MRKFVASAFGAGLIPNRIFGSHSGAGTFGALVAVAIGIPLIGSPWYVDTAVAAAAVGLSLWAAAPFSTQGRDPAWVAIDEVAGTLVAMIGLSGLSWIVAVVIARLLDIYKVAPGIRRAEAAPGAIGVTLDDVVAGWYGLACGLLILAI